PLPPTVDLNTPDPLPPPIQIFNTPNIAEFVPPTPPVVLPPTQEPPPTIYLPPPVYGGGGFSPKTPVVATPEPATWVLMVTGLFGAVFAVSLAKTAGRKGPKP